MKVLNLYAGIGGNRKLWTNVDVTAIEINPDIAKVYQDFFPDDTVIVADAHQYLLEHFKEFDFIWSSPPCPSHSIINKCFTYGNATNPVVYPDMNLYQEIILLGNYFNGKYCVENVISYYKPLIRSQEMARHYFWANFWIKPVGGNGTREHYGEMEKLQKIKGFNIDNYRGIDKRKTLRNCVPPELGLHIFKSMNNQELRLAL